MGSRSITHAGFPNAAPPAASKALQFADVGVTATAKEFSGIYREKKHHEPDFKYTLDRAISSGVSRLLLTSMRLADIGVNEAIAKCRPAHCFMTAGVHPYHATEVTKGGEEYLQQLSREVHDLLRQKPSPLAAFGEIGLDFDRLQYADKQTQIDAFKAQLDLHASEKFDLPLFLHCRAAMEDFVAIIAPYAPKLRRRGLVHSFVGCTDDMRRLVALGFDISVNAFSFATDESRKMVAEIPLDHLQLETDSPWGYLPDGSEVVKQYCVNATNPPLAKKRNKWQADCMVKERNESCMMERIAFVVAGLKGITVEEVAARAWDNSTRMFGL